MSNLSRHKYLAKNTLIFALGNIGNKFISFILVPLYTYVLTTAEYGTVDLIYTIGILLIPVLTLDISDAIMRFSMDKDANHHQIASISLTILGGALCSALLVFPIGGQFDAIKDYTLYLYGFIASLATAQVFLITLRGKEMLLRYSIGSIIQSFGIALFNIIFLVVFDFGVKGYLSSYIVANILTAGYAFFAGGTYKSFKHFSINKKLLKEMLKYSVFMIPTTLTWWVMNSSDRIMVSAIIGSAANGIYAAAYKLPTILTGMTEVFNHAWMFSAVKEEESSDRDEFNNGVYNRLVIFILLCAIGLMMIIHPFLHIYVSPDFYDAWRYIPYLLIGFVFMTIANFLSITFAVHKDSFHRFISGAIGAVTNIILNLILINIIGIAGAAIATAVSYFVMFVYNAAKTRKYVKLRLFSKTHIIGFVLLLITAATVYLDNWIGQVLLCAEFLVMLFLSKDVWLTLIKGMVKKLKSKKKKAE